MTTHLELAAEQLAAEWAHANHTTAGPRETSLATHVLTALADPRSDHADLLDDLTQRRWVVGQATPRRTA